MAEAAVKLSPEERIRTLAEKDLLSFAKLVNPNRVYGKVHERVFHWFTRPAAMDNQLLLLPRDHQKSHCAAVYAAWVLTKDPTSTILYVSATSDLAEKQLYAIKNILKSNVYRKYWPDMIHPEEGKRESWSVVEIAVDHPLRQEEGVRDPSIKAAGLTTNITGFHATHVFLDDVVVPNNAYTAEGRTKVENLYSQLASIETTGAKETVVGTRYFPRDLYQTLMDMEEEVFDDDGEHTGYELVYEVMEEVVEEQGVFLWPRDRRKDGKWFGFDMKELARKKAKYVDRTQFYAQYYQDPNDPSTNNINRDLFQHYDRKHLERTDGAWYIKDRKLNVYAAIDFAFATNKKADYTAIVVIGIDIEGQIYVMDIDRFRTGNIKEYYEHIVTMHTKWYFRRLRAEATAAQVAIIKELRSAYITPNGLALTIEENFPPRGISKEERVDAIIRHKYENQSIWHYQGGLCTELEDEVAQRKPEHDDIKDTLAAAVEIAVPPTRRATRNRTKNKVISMASHRFGGIAG